MALIVADRVQETTTTTGTGTYTLAGAKDGFQSFAAVGDGNTTYYACTDGTDYEVGIGTFTLSGTTLARTTIIESSNSDLAVSWGAGSKDIFVTLPASKATVLDASGNATFTGDVTFEGATAGRDIVFDRSANQLRFSDNAKAVFGDGTDATIHWNGSALEFSSELGDVLIRGNNEIKLQAHTGENFFVGLSNGASTLYYDNSAKLATTSTGINVTGNITVSGTVDGVDIAANIPSSLGTAGQVLTVNAGATAGEWADAGGGASAYTIDNKTTAYTVVAGDLGKIINCTSGTFTITLTAAATLGSGFSVYIWNTGTGAITIDGNASETIDGATTYILRQNEGTEIVCDGSNFSTGAKKTMRGYAENLPSTYGKPVASGAGAIALGNRNGDTVYLSQAQGTRSFAVNGYATANYSAAIGQNSSGGGAEAGGAGAMALGGSYASGTDSFAAAIANNSTSYGATGSSSIAMGYLTKATGSGSVSLGSQTTASGTYSLSLGYVNTASQNYSAVLGGRSNSTSGDWYTTVVGGYSNVSSGRYSAVIGGNQSSATAENSFATGEHALADQYGKLARASGRFAATGDAQGGQFILRAATTDATPTVLTTTNSAGSSANQIEAASDTCITFDGTITAMQNGAQAYASWKIEGLLVNDGGTTTLANSATTVIQNLSSWGMALSADNTNNALAITVTGEAAHNIRWVANIRTTEVTYA